MEVFLHLFTFFVEKSERGRDLGGVSKVGSSTLFSALPSENFKFLAVHKRLGHIFLNQISKRHLFEDTFQKVANWLKVKNFVIKVLIV